MLLGDPDVVETVGEAGLERQQARRPGHGRRQRHDPWVLVGDRQQRPVKASPYVVACDGNPSTSVSGNEPGEDNPPPSVLVGLPTAYPADDPTTLSVGPAPGADGSTATATPSARSAP